MDTSLKVVFSEGVNVGTGVGVGVEDGCSAVFLPFISIYNKKQAAMIAILVITIQTIF